MTVFIFPGQGSQKVGMGEGLFERYPELTQKADAILGYSIADLCLKDPNNQLGNTAYTQPALYVVNALTNHLQMNSSEIRPTFVAGHSLGEYNALLAAGAVDFETGLRLVKKRGEIMAKAQGGGMAAVVGLSVDQIKQVLMSNHLDTIDIANMNSHTQVVISGMKDDVVKAQSAFESAGAKMFIPLNVSGAFHSRYMTAARDEFQETLANADIKIPEIPVIANLSATPYLPTTLKENLVDQINHSVRWTESIDYLLRQGETDFIEVGPGKVLTGLVTRIKRGQ